MLALPSTYFFRKLFTVARFDHNITQSYTILLLLVYSLSRTAEDRVS